jgi:hypothetical protein
VATWTAGSAGTRFDVRPQSLERTRADPRHAKELVDRAECPMSLAVLDDASCEHGADPRQPIQILDRGAVQVER